MKLYLSQISGNSHKVRILLALLNVAYDKVVLDLSKHEHKNPEFLKINPRGEVPVLEDDGAVIWDSGACLVYIARKHGLRMKQVAVQYRYDDEPSTVRFAAAAAGMVRDLMKIRWNDWRGRYA